MQNSDACQCLKIQGIIISVLSVIQLRYQRISMLQIRYLAPAHKKVNTLKWKGSLQWESLHTCGFETIMGSLILRKIGQDGVNITASRSNYLNEQVDRDALQFELNKLQTVFLGFYPSRFKKLANKHNASFCYPIHT